ncbi:MAG: diaminopimelate epimerase [Muribaculaceae bacterium]|nr:diaminopimelate epimerase [Muribaculaceae bacterium]
MKEEIRFTKMHGIGNDYVYIDCTTHTPDRLEELSIEMSDRHTGVGGDGIILILPSEVADFKMRIFNADGSEAKMCGNGIRCVGKYVYDNGLTSKTEIAVDTNSGIKYLTLTPGTDGKIAEVTVDMGEPDLIAAQVPVKYDGEKMIEAEVDTTTGGRLAVTAVSMGNPHGVIFYNNESPDVHVTGRELEIHPMWPDRANIEFAKVISPTEINMRVWERGSGETMACGTGACATAVAAITTGRTERTVTIHLLGGDLTIFWNPDDNHVYMTGSATTVFTGVYPRQN